MPSELGPFEPTIPFQPGAEYVNITQSFGVQPYFDGDTVYLDIQVYVTEEFPVVYFNLQAITTVETAQFVDSATVYLDLTLTGGECFSSSSGITLDAEAYARWFANAEQRWLANDDLLAASARWFAREFLQFSCTEDDVNLRWVVLGLSTSNFH